MRVLSVVTLVSPLGEYGGPVRVAVNQARALTAQGHAVTLAGAARGFPGRLPSSIEGVDAVLRPARTLLPGIGFAGVGSPALWGWLRRHVKAYDVVHIHAARDLVTLPAAHIAAARSVPYVLQTHGMIDASSRLLARPLDAVMTRPALRRARRVLYLTPTEQRALAQIESDLPLSHLANGVPSQPIATPDPAQRTVLYLARLAPRKRPHLFVQAARRLGPERRDVSWVLIGPDEGEGPRVRAEIEQARAEGVNVSWDGPVAPEATIDLMRRAEVYVLPSVDEPYAMSVLEAMSVGLPVVITDTAGLAGVVREADAGAVVDDSLDDLCQQIARLLDDPERARAQGRNGWNYVRSHLTMESIARELTAAYQG